MKKGPFKMKDMDFGVSPVKQDRSNRPPKGFDWKASKKRAKEMVKKFGAKTGHGTIKDVVKKSAKTAGKRALGFLGFMGGGSLSATATPKGTQTDLANFKFGRGEKIK